MEAHRAAPKLCLQLLGRFQLSCSRWSSSLIPRLACRHCLAVDPVTMAFEERHRRCHTDSMARKLWHGQGACRQGTFDCTKAAVYSPADWRHRSRGNRPGKLDGELLPLTLLCAGALAGCTRAESLIPTAHLQPTEPEGVDARELDARDRELLLIVQLRLHMHICELTAMCANARTPTACRQPGLCRKLRNCSKLQHACSSCTILQTYILGRSGSSPLSLLTTDGCTAHTADSIYKQYC